MSLPNNSLGSYGHWCYNLSLKATKHFSHENVICSKCLRQECFFFFGSKHYEPRVDSSFRSSPISGAFRSSLIWFHRLPKYISGCRADNIYCSEWGKRVKISSDSLQKQRIDPVTLGFYYFLDPCMCTDVEFGQHLCCSHMVRLLACLIIVHDYIMSFADTFQNK